jgi:hypothetical protein
MRNWYAIKDGKVFGVKVEGDVVEIRMDIVRLIKAGKCSDIIYKSMWSKEDILDYMEAEDA